MCFNVVIYPYVFEFCHLYYLSGYFKTPDFWFNTSTNQPSTSFKCYQVFIFRAYGAGLIRDALRMTKVRSSATGKQFTICTKGNCCRYHRNRQGRQQPGPTDQSIGSTPVAWLSFSAWCSGHARAATADTPATRRFSSLCRSVKNVCASVASAVFVESCAVNRVCGALLWNRSAPYSLVLVPVAFVWWPIWSFLFFWSVRFDSFSDSYRASTVLCFVSNVHPGPTVAIMQYIRYTRNLFLRGVSVIYLQAFVALYVQNSGKFGITLRSWTRRSPVH